VHVVEYFIVHEDIAVARQQNEGARTSLALTHDDLACRHLPDRRCCTHRWREQIKKW
jgi:hypothetical protein